jgi:hypothetical protein
MGGVTNLIAYVSAAVAVGYLLKSTDYISWSAQCPSPFFLSGADLRLSCGSDRHCIAAQEDR